MYCLGLSVTYSYRSCCIRLWYYHCAIDFYVLLFIVSWYSTCESSLFFVFFVFNDYLIISVTTVLVQKLYFKCFTPAHYIFWCSLFKMLKCLTVLFKRVSHVSSSEVSIFRNDFTSGMKPLTPVACYTQMLNSKQPTQIVEDMFYNCHFKFCFYLKDFFYLNSLMHSCFHVSSALDCTLLPM